MSLSIRQSLFTASILLYIFSASSCSEPEKRDYDKIFVKVDSLIYLGKFDTTLQILDEIYNATDDWYEQSRVYYNKGKIYSQMQEFNLSEKYFKKSIELVNENGDDYIAVYFGNSLGTLYNDFGKSDKALELYRNYLNKSIERGYILNAAAAYNNIGVLFFENFRHLDFFADSALKYYHKVVEILDTVDRKSDLYTKIYDNLAITYASKKDSLNSMMYLQKALDINHLDSPDKAMTLLNASSIYFEFSDFNKAKNYYLESVKLGKKLEMHDFLVNAKIEYIKNLYAKKKLSLDVAAKMLRAVYNEAEKPVTTLTKNNVIRTITDMYKENGMKPKYTDLKSNYDTLKTESFQNNL